MDTYTEADLQEALRPIASLISKSEKALQKLTPGTWQHKMLQSNLKALRHASALMGDGDTNNFTQDDQQETLQALASMIRRTEEAQIKFVSGTSQYTLLRNRLNALRIALLFVTKTSDPS